MEGISFFDIIRSEGAFRLKAVKLFDHLVGGLIARCLPVRKNDKAHLPSGPLKILLIRPGGIGDAVFLLPIIRELKKAGHAVDVLCERRNAEVFLSQDGLCKSIFRYNVWSEFGGVFHQTYDVVIDTEQWHNLSAVIAALLKSKLRIGFATRPSRARLFDVQVPYDLHEYELKCFARLVEGLGDFSALQLKGAYHVAASDAAWAKGSVQGEYIVLALGGSISMRRFSQMQAEDICRLALNKGSGVVLLGGKDVGGFSEVLSGKVKDQRVVNFAGKVSLSRSAGLIAGAKRFIGHDSGMLHLASALGAPVVAVFGPGNKNKWGPHGVEDKIISSGVDCSPCTRFGYTFLRCRGLGKCLKEVNGDTFL